MSGRAFEDAWNRYTPVEGGSECNNRNIGSTLRFSGDSAAATAPSVLRSQNGDWLNQADVADVAVQTPKNGVRTLDSDEIERRRHVPEQLLSRLSDWLGSGQIRAWVGPVIPRLGG
jgi:hypothetical protein